MFSSHRTLLPGESSPNLAKSYGHISRQWRKGAVFDRGNQFRRPIDRNDRARIIVCTEGLERRTKAKGKQNGIIGQSGLAVLRALLFGFLNTKTGRLDPSYRQIQERTGFCVETISRALKALERAGVLEIVRRIVRERAQVSCPLTGRAIWVERTVQMTNAYMANFPLPDRTQFGDLGAPLLHRRSRGEADSTSQKETTSAFIESIRKPPQPTINTISDSGLRASLERLREALEEKARRESDHA